jgi:hypothetical protein
VSRQQVWGPAEHAKARAMHATHARSKLSDGQSTYRKALRSCSTARIKPASLETPDSVQTVLGKGCGKPLRSRTTLGKAKAAK